VAALDVLPWRELCERRGIHRRACNSIGLSPDIKAAKNELKMPVEHVLSQFEATLYLPALPPNAKDFVDRRSNDNGLGGPSNSRNASS
jgi:hypothetical protein